MSFNNKIIDKAVGELIAVLLADHVWSCELIMLPCCVQLENDATLRFWLQCLQKNYILQWNERLGVEPHGPIEQIKRGICQLN